MSKSKSYLDASTETPSSQFDWEELKLQLNPTQFSVLVAKMPVEPPVTLTSSVTFGMYPVRNTNIFKKD